MTTTPGADRHAGADRRADADPRAEVEGELAGLRALIERAEADLSLAEEPARFAEALERAAEAAA